MKNVLVVGAKHYVGSNFCNKLDHIGIDVIAILNKGSDYSLLLNIDVLFQLVWSGLNGTKLSFRKGKVNYNV